MHGRGGVRICDAGVHFGRLGPCAIDDCTGGYTGDAGFTVPFEARWPVSVGPRAPAGEGWPRSWTVERDCCVDRNMNRLGTRTIWSPLGGAVSASPFAVHCHPGNSYAVRGAREAANRHRRRSPRLSRSRLTATGLSPPCWGRLTPEGPTCQPPISGTSTWKWGWMSVAGAHTNRTTESKVPQEHVFVHRPT
jgi:hypothetical protein